jgi:methionyl-tRNA formyltransferase
LANTVAAEADEVMIVSECKPLSASNLPTSGEESPVTKHFALRDEVEQEFFKGNDYFKYPCLPITHKEVNAPSVYEAVKSFGPDLIFVYGASIIRKPLLELLPYGKIINLHLGVSPYYRGSGTNFWPFVNLELEFVGSTLLNIDAGVDTGDIIAHVRPEFKADDTVHSAGCKVIQDSAEALKVLMSRAKNGQTIKAVKQWETNPSRYYRKKDFGVEALKTYYANLKNGVVLNHIQSPTEVKDIIQL